MDSFLLEALAANAPIRLYRITVDKHRRTIYRHPDDLTEARNFGLWLQQRCQLPFTDLTTTETKARQLEALKQQLANSGRLGRIALRLIGGLLVACRPPDSRD